MEYTTRIILKFSRNQFSAEISGKITENVILGSFSLKINSGSDAKRLNLHLNESFDYFTSFNNEIKLAIDGDQGFMTSFPFFHALLRNYHVIW